MTKHKGSWGQGQDSVIFVHHLLQPGAQGCNVAHIRQSAHIRCSAAFVRQVTVNASVLRI